jgi:hypothetical protein
LSNYDRAPLYKESSVDRLNATVAEAMDLAIPSGFMRKIKYHSWFCGKLKFYIRNKFFYTRFKKSKAEYFYNKFSLYLKPVKATAVPNRLEWLKFLDENLKSHPEHFWKCVEI